MEQMDEQCNIRKNSTLDEYIARFEAGMKILNGPDGHRRVEAAFEARGKFPGNRPIAGPSF